MSTCRECNAPLRWHKSPKTGKSIPLDEEERYMLLASDGKDWGYADRAGGTEHVKGHLQPKDFDPEPGELDRCNIVAVHINHFLTCTNPKRFSGRNG